MKLNEMRDLLNSRGIQLTKSLGQNFLHDQNQIQRIVALAELRQEDKVLEIGPGLGPLTEALLESGAHVLAIEKDQRLCEILRERFSTRANFELLNADALNYLKARGEGQGARDWRDWKCVSNLPYSVASPILVELALVPSPPERIVATLQSEVAQRIMAAADTEHYGQLSLFLQLRYKPDSFIKIPAGSFFPPPEVESTCILLRRRAEVLIDLDLIPKFFRVVKLAFSARRKMMSKLLKQQWAVEAITGALAEAGVSSQARAETVTLEQFVTLTKALVRLSSKDKGNAQHAQSVATAS
jgi:16S rRNA (adenine1518-N6/adenine1519-N6)-dimethyltransferase